MIDSWDNTKRPIFGFFDSTRIRHLGGLGRLILRYGLVALLLKDIMLLGAALYTSAEALEAAQQQSDHLLKG